jgi:divalent metal cation (Fe/Co/Zn/Cd) transporter
VVHGRLERHRGARRDRGWARGRQHRADRLRRRQRDRGHRGGRALLWRFARAKADASEDEHSTAERQALYVVSATFFALAAYITVEATHALVSREEPETSAVGLLLSVVSLVVMPTLAYAKRRTGRALGSRALLADAVETWVCAYLSLALLVGTGLNLVAGWWWADPVAALAMLPVIAWQGWETLAEAREKQSEDE